MIENYKTMFIDENLLCHDVNILIPLYEIINSYQNQEKSFDDIDSMLRKIQDTHFKSRHCDILLTVVQEYFIKVLKKETSYHFMTWCCLACLGNKSNNPLPIMLQWELPVWVNDNDFENDLNTSVLTQKNIDKFIIWIAGRDSYDGVLARWESSTNEYKLLKRRLKMFQEFNKKSPAQHKVMPDNYKKVSGISKDKQKSDLLHSSSDIQIVNDTGSGIICRVKSFMHDTFKKKNK
jgi:hypothetical protein